MKKPTVGLFPPDVHSPVVLVVLHNSLHLRSQLTAQRATHPVTKHWFVFLSGFIRQISVNLCYIPFQWNPSWLLVFHSIWETVNAQLDLQFVKSP